MAYRKNNIQQNNRRTKRGLKKRDLPIPRHFWISQACSEAMSIWKGK